MILIKIEKQSVAGLHWCRRIFLCHAFNWVWHNFCVFFIRMGESSVQKFPRKRYNTRDINGISVKVVQYVDEPYSRPSYYNFGWDAIVSVDIWGKYPHKHFKDHIWFRPIIVFCNWRWL